MTYEVGIARRDGSVDGWVFGLPGCRSIGGSVDEVRELLPAAIGEFQAWLAWHGEQSLAEEGTDFEFVEDVSSNAEFCFEADRQPLQAGGVAMVIEWLRFAQRDLADRARFLPATVLNWKPPASAVKIDQIYPDVRTINDMLSHVVSALNFHLSGVGDLTKRLPAPEGPLALDAAFDLAAARLRALNAEELAGEVYRRSTPRGESEWSARKALRRVLNHVRFHTREIEQRLCWLTLGVPEVLPVSRE
jgi:hypothetical protein